MSTIRKLDIRSPLSLFYWIEGTPSLEARQVKIIALPAASIARADRDRNNRFPLTLYFQDHFILPRESSYLTKQAQLPNLER